MSNYVTPGYVAEGYVSDLIPGGITVNHATYVITIPKAATTLIGTNPTTGYEIRSLDEYVLMRQIADYLDGEDGIALPPAFSHNTQVTISGVAFARAISFLAPYTITFENLPYQVKLVGGSNNNILDVLNPNNVSVIAANSAGLQTVNTGGGGGTTAADVWAYGSRTLTTAAAPTAEQIATEVLAAAQLAPIHANAVSGAWPTDADVATEVLAAVVEGSLTLQGAIRLLTAVAAGDATGLEGASMVFKSLDGLKDRVTATYVAGSRDVTARDAT